MRITIEKDSGGVIFLEGDAAESWYGVTKEAVQKLAKLGKLGDLKTVIEGIKWNKVEDSSVGVDEFMGEEQVTEEETSTEEDAGEGKSEDADFSDSEKEEPKKGEDKKKKAGKGKKKKEEDDDFLGMQ